MVSQWDTCVCRAGVSVCESVCVGHPDGNGLEMGRRWSDGTTTMYSGSQHPEKSQELPGGSDILSPS